MELPKAIAGVDARKVREMFKNFVEEKIEFARKDGELNVKPPKITAEQVRTSLNVVDTEAERIHTALVAEGWIDADKLVPTATRYGPGPACRPTAYIACGG